MDIMHKFKQLFLGLLVIIGGLWSPQNLQAFNAEPPCFKDLEENFFRDDLVLQALSLQYNWYSQGQWALIVRGLHDRSRDIPYMLERRASLARPSPLEYPFQYEQASKLLFEILFEVFHQVMIESGITNEGIINSMFKYIRDQQANRINACLGTKPSTL